jgi:hypothetical protein
MRSAPLAWRMTQTVVKKVLYVTIVFVWIVTCIVQAEDQPPSGPPDMLALYLTHIDGKSMRLSYPAQQKTYTLRITLQTVFCNHGKRDKSWEFLQEHIGKGKNVITVKTDPERKVALIVWNTGPSIVTRGTSPMNSSTSLAFPEACVTP